jgi:predicted Zn-dependent peptidase
MYQKTVLGNGLRIVTEKVPSSRIVSVGIWTEVGSRDEHPENNGCSHFLEHMLFKGTKKRTAQQIAKELDVLGGMSNAFTSTETTCYYSSLLDKHLPRVVELFSDFFLHSVFDDDEIERERQVILQEISMVEDTPDDQIHDLFSSLLWGDNPMGNTVLGSREIVSAMDSRKLIDFYDQFYHPANILITAAGNVDHESFCGLWEKEFAGLAGKLQKEEGRIIPQKIAPHKKVYTKPLEQVHMLLGTYGLPAIAEERFSLYLLNILLGGNMSSRLFQEIREKRGLAYSVYSNLSSLIDCGQIGIYLGLDKGTANEALMVVNKELNLLKGHTITAEELANVKEYSQTGLYLTAENMEARMTQLAKNEMYFDRHIPLDELLEGINRVTCENLTELAQQIFSQPLSAVVIGPVEDSDIDWQLIQ